MSEEELLQLARENDVREIVLTDINNTSACLNMVRRSAQFGIRVHLGVDFRVKHSGSSTEAQQAHNIQLYVMLAQSNEGFFHINRFLSHHSEQKLPFPIEPPVLPDTVVIYPFERALELEEKQWTGNQYIGVTLHELRKLPFTRLHKLKDRIVLLQTVTLRNKRDWNTHKLLRAIDHNTLLSKISPEQCARESDVMYPLQIVVDQLMEFEHILDNTIQIMDTLDVSFDFSPDRPSLNQSTYTGDINEDMAVLRELCYATVAERYPNTPPHVYARMEKELNLIQQMKFVSYFLINWRICDFARARGFFYVGRGSGANSIVAYILRITDVDPIDLDLYFERFINLYRSSPPDFDIDFSWQDREEITEFIFNEFPNTALLATYVTFRYKAVMRELGKVFGLPKHDIDKLAAGNLQPHELDQMHNVVLKYSKLIQGMPNYLSIHAGGILITDKPIHYYSATDLPPKGFPTVQFDMIIAEDVGMYKFDILSQRGLGKIKDAVEIVRENQPHAPEIDIHNIDAFKNDDRINHLLTTAQCVGCFYVESPAMRSLMTRMGTASYLDLVIASSIIRPGVSNSGMMKEFIVRHRDPSRRSEAHPVMLDIMPETHGVMVYQEDVIKVAHHFAGLTLSEADVLRRGMSGKYRSRAEFQKIEQKFMDNCADRGYDPAVTNEVWRQISSFAGYAFAKGHSASYAVESYQSLFLKCYYPLEYMVACLNNGGGFYKAQFYVHEARLHGATIHAPCVNRGEHAVSIQGTDIFLGMGYLKDLEIRTVQRLLNERNFNGKYASFEDFIDRVPISAQQVSILIRIGAFRFTKRNRYELLWDAYYKLGNTKAVQETQVTMFRPSQRQFELPRLHSNPLEEAFEQMELLGFPLCSPFELLADPLKPHINATDMLDHVGQHVLMYGHLVTIKPTKTKHGELMFFGTFLDPAGAHYDSVLFPKVAQQYRFVGPGIYAIYGTIITEQGYPSLCAEQMKKMDYVQDPRYSEGTDQGSKLQAQSYRMEKMKQLAQRRTQIERTGRVRNRDGSVTVINDNDDT